MSLLLSMFGFSLAMSISPGPVNMIILSSGATNGFRRTIPFVSGATIGFTFLLAALGFGFYQAVSAYPTVMKYLSIAGAAFIIYMAVKIALSTQTIKTKEKKAPNFFEGFLLQWLNPKAWMACVSGVSLFSRPDSYLTLVSFIFIYFLVCYASLTIVAIAGDRMTAFLSNANYLKIFNLFMAMILIVASVYLVVSQFWL